MNHLHTIYFDESGYTGSDFLNADQPVFCVASTDIDEGEARTILKTSFPRFQGKEFKFTRINRRPRHRPGLVLLSEQLSRMVNRIFIYNCDKKFTALVKAVDVLVEPLFYERGSDFYAGGYNRRYVNMFHFGLCQFTDSVVYDAIVRWYDRFSRSRNDASAIHELSQIAERCPDEMNFFVKMLLAGAKHCIKSRDLNMEPMDNDIQQSCVLALVNHWREHTAGAIEIVHDASSNFFRQVELWHKITSTDIKPATVTAGDRRGIIFPLGVVRTRPGDSVDSYALQLCDMIAGLSAHLRRRTEEVDLGFRRDIVAAGFGQLRCDGIIPGSEFVEGFPEVLNGPDVVDQFITATTRQG